MESFTMAEDLQGLLNKIHTDGIQKAEEEKAAIIADAKKEAAKIIADAKAQAETDSEKAKAFAAAEQDKAFKAIQQASRDAVIALKADLLAKLNAVARDCAAKAMTPGLMGQIILEMAKAYRQNPSSDAGIELLLPQKEQGEVEGVLKSALLADLKANLKINLTNEFGAGLQISFADNEVFFDFSDEALADILCKFVGPKLAAVIKG